MGLHEAGERPQAALPPPPEGDEQSNQVTFAHEPTGTSSRLADRAALADSAGSGRAEAPGLAEELEAGPVFASRG